MARTTVYNSITSKEKLDKIDPENLQLGEDWLEYMQSIDRSPKSIVGYRSDLRIFWVWNMEFNNNKFFTKLTKREIAKFQNHAINVWGWSPNRIRRVKSCLSSLSNYIENVLDDEEAFEDFRPIIRKIENPNKEAVREKTVLPDETIDFLLKTLVERKEYEKACAVAIAAYSGMRKSELLQMKVEYFDENHFVYDSMWKTDKIRTKGFGRLGKPLNKFILYGAKPYLDLWLNERNEKGINSDYLFVSKTKDANGDIVWKVRQDLTHWTDEFSAIIGMAFYFHCERHFTCTKLHRMNLPAHVIQEFFGWTSSEMLNIYNDLSAEDEFGKYFDKNGVKEIKQGSLSEV
ncbi:MAG: tyrosine-type recombinase/integrase [Clostridiales bacterium]|nr:tyrosine-type recombinase/integrase [Clostridiales bacterium]